MNYRSILTQRAVLLAEDLSDSADTEARKVDTRAKVDYYYIEPADGS